MRKNNQRGVGIQHSDAEHKQEGRVNTHLEHKQEGRVNAQLTDIYYDIRRCTDIMGLNHATEM